MSHSYSWFGTDQWPDVLLITLYNACAVPWRDIMSTVGGYLDKCGGISWVPWGCSIPWGDIMSTGGLSWVPWGVILSTVGVILSTVGVILSTVGCSVTWGYYDARWGDIMNTVGVFSTVGDSILWNLSTVGDITIHVGDIMSTVGGVQ